VSNWSLFANSTKNWLYVPSANKIMPSIIKHIAKNLTKVFIGNGPDGLPS